MVLNRGFILEPQLKEKVWGGRRLAEAFAAGQRRIGEAWLVADENTVASGEFAGLSLRTALMRVGPDFWGGCPPTASFPLLVKLLDTSDWLSVQVHPDDDFAARYESNTGYTGKDEVWIVLEAGPAARVVYGFNRDLERDELEDAIAKDQLWPLLNVTRVEPGDVIYLPAGTVHALGPDLLVLEVSQRSDLTYRLYDFDRGRRLDLEKALAVASLKEGRLQPLRLREGLHLDLGKFGIVTIDGAPADLPAPFVLAGYDAVSSAALFPAGRVGDVADKNQLLVVPGCPGKRVD